LAPARSSTPAPPTPRPAAAPAGAPPLPAPGQLLIGRVSAARGSGVLVQLGWHALGLVSLSDIHDSWVPNALAGLQEGAFVRARVLDSPPDARGRLRLSLRPSDGGEVEGLKRAAPPAGAEGAKAPPKALKAEQLAEGCEVRGPGAIGGAGARSAAHRRDSGLYSL
jgi:rRNA biogenesis protein RRP5